jgi:hypothetical protein
MADIIETFADGTVIERNYTEQELAQIEADRLEFENRKAEKEAKAAAKEAAQAKLAALGLTTQDLQALGF